MSARLALAAILAGLVGAARGDVSLAGVWQVVGSNFTGRAELPGTLAAAHLGTRWTERDFTNTMDLPQSEALAQEWQYAGVATWSRTVELDAATCAHPAEIFLERVMWSSEVLFDGVSLGTADSLATPHVHPIPPHLLTPGRHEIRLVIDNGCKYGFSRQSHAYGPNMQAIWNGVLGRVEIRRRHPLRAARVFASAPANRCLQLEVPAGFDAAAKGAITLDGNAIVAVASAPSPYRSDCALLTLTLRDEPAPWSPARPILHALTLRDGDFARTIPVGFRTYGVAGHAITVNGAKSFLRGNVENANFARDGIPWMSVAEWARVFRLLKVEDGIDTMRFHSWCPPEAAFRAADEVGILLQPEAGIWTDSWMSDGDPIGKGLPVDGFVARELAAIGAAYGDSPSFLSLSIGNELGNSDFARMGEMIAAARAADPRHLYYASSARTVNTNDDISLSHVVPGKGLARERLFPRTDWDYEEIYAASRVPTIAHEIGQWPVYPLWDDLLAPFTGTMRPWNLSRHRDTARRTGTIRFQRAYHAASAKLNRLIYKEEVESFLRTPSCAGLQLLEIQDYTGQAEALVGWRDPFYALKAGFRDLPPFATVWGPVSYLARFARFTWQAGETFSAVLQIRNLTGETLPAGRAFPFALGPQKGELKLEADLPAGELATLGTVSLPLSDDLTAAKQTLTFGTNRWNFWVYPKEAACVWPEGLVRTADPEEMKRALAEGRTVLYTGPSHASAKGSFRPVYWSARWFPIARPTAAALGTWFDVAHPVFRGFVTEDFTDWQWYTLAQGATIHALRDLPPDYRPFALSVNDFHLGVFAATMFEARIGRGRLFVCGYDLDAGTPEARRLRASVARYLEGVPAAGTPVCPPEWLARQFDGERAPDLSGAVYDETIAWTGRTYRTELRGIAPVVGRLRLDFRQTGSNLTSGRGFVEGRVFEVPFTHSKNETTFVEVPLMREDFLDGRIEIEAHVMTGPHLTLERIRILPEDAQ